VKRGENVKTWLNRIVLVGVLLAIGAISAGVATNGGGTFEVFSLNTPNAYKIVGNLDNDSVSVISPDGQVYTMRTHYKDMETGKIEKNGENLTISVGGNVGEIKVVGFNLSLTEEQKQRAIEMALNDEKVKELVDGKNYTILKVGPWVRIGAIGSKTRLGTEQEAELVGASVWLRVENKCYYVGVNFESSKVDVQEIMCMN